MSTRKNLIVLAILFTAIAGLNAQGTVTLVRQRQGVSFAEGWRPNGSGDTRIIGQVLDISQNPVAYARVQIRNLISGFVEQRRESDANGEYLFVVDNPGSYVVEMVQIDGYVVALSNAGAIARYETLNTMVRLPGRWGGDRRGLVMPQPITDFIGMSAATSITAQTVQIALEQSVQPVDSGEPVSPNKP